MTTHTDPCHSKDGATPCEKRRYHHSEIHRQGAILWRSDGSAQFDRPRDVWDVRRVPALDSALDLLADAIEELEWAKGTEELVSNIENIRQAIREDRGQVLNAEHDRERANA